MSKSMAWAATWAIVSVFVIWAAVQGDADLAIPLWGVSNAPLIWAVQAKERGL